MEPHPFESSQEIPTLCVVCGTRAQDFLHRKPESRPRTFHITFVQPGTHMLGGITLRNERGEMFNLEAVRKMLNGADVLFFHEFTSEIDVTNFLKKNLIIGPTNGVVQ